MKASGSVEATMAGVSMSARAEDERDERASRCIFLITSSIDMIPSIIPAASAASAPSTRP
jgi:hypothetical protein